MPEHPPRCPCCPRPPHPSCPSRLELGAWGSGLGASKPEGLQPSNLNPSSLLAPTEPGKKPQTNPKKLKKKPTGSPSIASPNFNLGLAALAVAIKSGSARSPKDRANADLLARVVPEIALLASGLLRSRIRPDASACSGLCSTSCGGGLFGGHV